LFCTLGGPVEFTLLIDSYSSGGYLEVGSSVDLFVVASGDGSLSYQWYKDDSPIDGETASELSFIADLSDSGTYFCRVTSEYTSVDSPDMDIAVYKQKIIGNLFGLNMDNDRGS
jgi:hypothetical protein